MLKFIHCCENDLPEKYRRNDSLLKEYAQSEEVFYAIPSFYDLQVNGFNGITLDGASGVTAEKLSGIASSLRKYGCMKFVPTLITSPYDVLRSSLAATADFMKMHPDVIPGLHIEGPFISMAKKGIHSEEYIRNLEGRDLELILEYADAVSYITLDPQRITPLNMQKLISRGIRISLGHTDAGYNEAEAFIKNGATLGTHLFNAMTLAKNGRTPMTAEAIMTSDNVYCGVIADGVHVNYGMLKLAHLTLGKRFVMVTDCLSAAGTDPHIYREFVFAGKTIYNTPDKGCIDAGGTLGGSRLTMPEGLANLVNHAGFTLPDAVYAACIAPAEALGERNTVPSVILGSDYSVRMVM